MDSQKHPDTFLDAFENGRVGWINSASSSIPFSIEISSATAWIALKHSYSRARIPKFSYLHHQWPGSWKPWVFRMAIARGMHLKSKLHIGNSTLLFVPLLFHPDPATSGLRTWWSNVLINRFRVGLHRFFNCLPSLKLSYIDQAMSEVISPTA